MINDTSDSDNEAAVVPSSIEKTTKVQRSSSQSDVHGAKRRRPVYSTKLKRCASLPSQKASRLELRLRQLRQDRDINEDSMDDNEAMIKMNSLSLNLQTVWNSFEAGDVLNFQQLEIVCEHLGLQKVAAKLAAEEVYEKLSLKHDSGISFDDFLNLIQSDSDMFSSMENVGQRTTSSTTATTAMTNNSKSDNTQVYQDIVPIFTSESGSITMEEIVNLWTSANILDADKFIHNLGFFGKSIKLSELSAVLEEEIQRDNSNEVQSKLLKASLALHKTEITSLRKSYRQVVDENKKLFADNKETNRRASILAQEIDERHSNLEDSTRTEIKSLELRHNEAIRELTTQLSAEREHLGNLNARLELKIKSMEIDEQKIRQELASLKEENCALENEQAELHKQITELLEQNIKLNQDFADMTAASNGEIASESHNEEMLDLIEKIETLQMENSNLRDKNDELLSDLESLNVEVLRLKNKNKPPVRDDEQEISTSAAIKRRGDSPSKSRLEESPRMGKVRKFSSDIEDPETSGDWMALNSELATSTPAAKVTATTYQQQNNNNNNDENIEQLKKKIFELESAVARNQSNNTSTANETTADDVTKMKQDNEKLQARVKELEENLELMSREYENCEDYWQAKVNEERLLFDEDQRQSDEKFAELLQKMTELEDQFATQLEKNNGRLSPIDEKCHLESQYLELENEMEELKVHAQSLLDEKSREIEKLQLEVSQLQNLSAIKTPKRVASPDSVASSPINYLLNQSTITGPIRDYQNPNYAKKKEENLLMPPEEEEEEPIRISPIQKPQSSTSSLNQQSQPVEPSREALELAEALSMISNKSIVSNSIQSLNELNDGSVSPQSVSESQQRIKKMKVIMDQMKEEIQEMTTQRESLIMELQQLQEARPILANAYVSFKNFSISYHFLKIFYLF